jgi:cyclic pyranopterin phosphate synthase
MAAYLKGDELILAKGPVFQTAIIAGTMAVKKTFETIPFCHQIPIESCKFFISIDANLLVTIQCRVKTSFKTGVEMEALHGALTAALTIYDMCKAVTHNIIIKETRLVAKTGGKRTILDRPLYGLVLTGGKSQRMGEAKALISYHGKSHAAYLVDILKDYCQEVFLSTAEEAQWKGTELENIPTIIDSAGQKFVFNKNSPISPWEHLLCTPSQLYQRLLKKTDSTAAEEIVYYTYHSPRLNRLFSEDYLRYFAISPFKVCKVVPTFNFNPPKELQAELERYHPGNKYFANNGFLTVLQRPL